MTYFTNYGAEYSGVATSVPPGGVFRPGVIDRPSVMKRVLQPRPELVWFDPQVYLLDMSINPAKSRKLLKCMDTYSWFGMTEREHESGEFELMPIVAGEDRLSETWRSRRDMSWPLRVKGVIRGQDNLPFVADEIVLPMRLISDPTSSLDEEWRMLDEAIDVARKLEPNKPLIATLPLADTLLVHKDPLKNSMLESIVENIDVRRESIAGVYIPLIQILDGRERVCNEWIAGSLLRLARLFGAKSSVRATFNFIESLGALCKAFGADSYCSGYSQRHRRMALKDFEEKRGGTGGFPPPRFFSRVACVDLRPEDLEALAKKDSLHLLDLDETPSSEDLFRGIRAGAAVSDIFNWAPTQRAYLTGKLQYFEQQQLLHSDLRSPKDAIAWLKDAKATWAAIQSVLQSHPKHTLNDWTNGDHLDAWLAASKHVLSESE